MDFRTKAMAEITAVITEEIGTQIEGGEIKNLADLESGKREIVKEIGVQIYGWESFLRSTAFGE